MIRDTQSEDAEVYPGKDGNVRYDEGVFIGYRHYDAMGIEPMFPFGHGLGYTRFAIEGMNVTETNGEVSANITVRNLGNRQGTTVVQLYLSDNESSIKRPEKELKGHSKLTLPAGEEATVSVNLSARDFAFYDENAGLWRVEAGTFTLSAGLSATDIQATASLERGAEEIGK